MCPACEALRCAGTIRRPTRRCRIAATLKENPLVLEQHVLPDCQYKFIDSIFGLAERTSRCYRYITVGI